MITNDIIIRQKITIRGGGIEISLDSFGFEGEKMTAYQNYLGGGILGKVTNDCTISNWDSNSKLKNIAEALKRYYFNLTNAEQGRFESITYEQNQKLRVSAY